MYIGASLYYGDNLEVFYRSRRSEEGNKEVDRGKINHFLLSQHIILFLHDNNIAQEKIFPEQIKGNRLVDCNISKNKK